MTATDRRARRREATADEIVAAAWALVREQGLSGLTMRDLGERVGMRAQSLYSYFASKHDIYDAMFAQGYRAFAAWMAEGEQPVDPLHRAKADARRFFAFCVSDPVRFQLLFQRTIPGFEPSPHSYRLALEVIDELVVRLGELGITDPRAVDLWTAVLTGLASLQIANDPGGQRWERLVDDAVEMYLAHVAPATPTSKRTGR